MEEESKFITFLKKHWSKLFLSLLAVACIAAWTDRLLKGNGSRNKQDFLTIRHLHESFQKGGFLPEESLESMENILARHPELHPKYDALLALTYFSQAKAAEGKHYAQALIQQADDQLPCAYKHYANTTLLIAEARYPEAFEACQQLETTLKECDYPKLQVMNTLRLVFLADLLGNHGAAANYWSQLQKLPLYPDIESLFHEGKLSLSDYMNTICNKKFTTK